MTRRTQTRARARQRLLGDRVDVALQATGIKPLVQTLAHRLGVDCGCARRTAALNRWDAARGQPNRKG